MNLPCEGRALSFDSRLPCETKADYAARMEFCWNFCARCSFKKYCRLIAESLPVQGRTGVWVGVDIEQFKSGPIDWTLAPRPNRKDLK